MMVFISNFFMSFFKSDGCGASQHLLDAVEGKVSPEMNDILMKEFSAEEVKSALKSIEILKRLVQMACPRYSTRSSRI